MTLLKNFSDLIFVMAEFLFSPNNLFLALIEKKVGFIQIKLKLMIKMSKNITRWVCPLHIIPLLINNFVTSVRLWHTNPWSFFSVSLRFDHYNMPLQVWKMILSVQVTMVILLWDIIIRLYYVRYNLYHLLPRHPKVWCVSCNNYILNILYLDFYWNIHFFQREGIIIWYWPVDNYSQTIDWCISRDWILA